MVVLSQRSANNLCMETNPLKLWQRLFGKKVVQPPSATLPDMHPGRLFPDYSQRKDLQVILVNDEVRLEVFWKRLAIGQGPAVSLFMLGEEVLRIDCFGSERPHLHASFFMPVQGEERLLIPEVTVEAQIDRAKFELCHNVAYYQARVLNANIRQIRLEPAALSEAAEKAASIMRGFAANIIAGTAA